MSGPAEATGLPPARVRVWWGTPASGSACRTKPPTTQAPLVLAEREAEVVRQRYRWVGEAQLSSSASEHRLHERAIPSRAGPANGWQHSRVRTILPRPRSQGHGSDTRTNPAPAHRPTRGKGLKDRRPGNAHGRRLRPREEW